MAESAESSGDKVALITGITGQDGSYLAELLLSKGYTVRVTTSLLLSLDTIRPSYPPRSFSPLLGPWYRSSILVLQHWTY